MPFDVTGLTDFTEKATELLREEVLFTDEISRYSIETNIQHEKYLNYVVAKANIQAGGCDLPADGSADFTERKIVVVPLAFRDKFCEDDLRKKGFVFKGGTNTGNLPEGVEEALTIEETQGIAEDLSNLRWVGDIAGGDLVDGWLTKAQSDPNVIEVTGAAPTLADIDDLVNDMVSAITPEMYARFKKTGEKFTIHVPMAHYKLYKQNRLNSNMFREQNTDYGTFEMDVFGEEGVVTIKAEQPLAGQTSWLLTQDSNLVIGTDEVEELAKAEWKYDDIKDVIWFKSDMKYGTQYYFSKEIIIFNVA